MHRGISSCLLAVVMCTTLRGMLCAQGFINITHQQDIHLNLDLAENGAGLSFFDFNQDGWDDLTLCTRNAPLRFYQNVQGQFTLIEPLVDVEGEIKSVTWCDYDNDGDADLFVGRFYDTSRFYRNEGNMVMTDISATCGLPQESEAMTYGASFGDLNRDGWLDLYICNYNWPTGITNWILLNDGNGGFTDISSVTVANDLWRRSFQSAIMDYNRDLWPDIFVANDKSTRNSLYVNYGNAEFGDVSFEAQCNHHMESMCASPADYDRDGDLDIYVSNSTPGNILLKNNEGIFSDEAPQLGLEFNLLCWGSLWLDYNNDGLEDLYVLSTWPHTDNRNKLYHSNENGTFSDVLVPGLATDITSAYANASGDLNNDGFADFMSVGNEPGHSRLWLNQGVGGNYLRIDLRGVQSNRQGVGVWIDAWYNGQYNGRYTMCGENYLAQNGGSEIIGLGDAEYLDSLILTWPSGQVDKYYHMAANQRVSLVEGHSFDGRFPLSAMEVCPNSEEQIGWEFADSVLWMDGMTEWVRSALAGSYSAYSYFQAISFLSDTLEVSQIEIPVWSWEISPPSCAGSQDGIAVLIDPTETLSATFGLTGEAFPMNSLGAGDYQGLISHISGCSEPFEFMLQEPDSLEVTELVSQVSCAGLSNGEVQLQISGGTAPYQITWTDSGSDSLAAGIYSWWVQDQRGCGIQGVVVIDEPPLLMAEVNITPTEEGDLGTGLITVNGGTPPYQINWSDGVTGALHEGLSQGVMEVIVTDDNGCSITLTAEWFPIFTEETGWSEEHSFYPNPTTGAIALETGWRILSVIDATGRAVELNHPVQHGACADLSGLSTGVYYLRLIRHSGEVLTQRLILTD
ncbi:MAG: FG-GAP-like repeat-containing protein [Flavobacteriales bacterium]